MPLAWGTYADMAIHYLKLLASTTDKDTMWIEDGDSGAYGVCSYQEYAELIANTVPGRYRPVSTMTRVEFMGLMLVRFGDFFPEDKKDADEKSVQTG